MRSPVYDPLDAAQSHQETAQFCVENDREGLAASEAYYAMYHTVCCMVDRRGIEYPSSHGGVEYHLYHTLIEAGPLSIEEHKRPFDHALESRERWHYQGKAPRPYVDLRWILAALRDMLDRVEEAH
jgi:uncharacterized protein (UPF0332 family)